MRERQKKMGIGGKALALLVSLIATTSFRTVHGYSSNTANKRWTATGGTSYETKETYTDVDGHQETYRMQWELYEGSISLVQMALVWKEISEEAQHQIWRTTDGGSLTKEMLRIRRIWQLENCQATY